MQKENFMDPRAFEAKRKAPRESKMKDARPGSKNIFSLEPIVKMVVHRGAVRFAPAGQRTGATFTQRGHAVRPSRKTVLDPAAHLSGRLGRNPRPRVKKGGVRKEKSRKSRKIVREKKNKTGLISGLDATEVPVSSSIGR